MNVATPKDPSAVKESEPLLLHQLQQQQQPLQLQEQTLCTRPDTPDHGPLPLTVHSTPQVRDSQTRPVTQDSSAVPRERVWTLTSVV